MYKPFLSATCFAAMALPGVLAQNLGTSYLMPQHDSTSIGDVCRSLQRNCAVNEFPSNVEKLCWESCEKKLDSDDLKSDVCGQFQEYLNSLGNCADNQLSEVRTLCKDKCGCASDKDCRRDEVCKNHACRPKPKSTSTSSSAPASVSTSAPEPSECHHNRECDGQVCKNKTCVPCAENADCNRSDLGCKDGKCVAISVPPPECLKNADCQGGQICKENGKCAPCSADIECGQDQLCGNGECMPKPPTCGQPGFEWAQWQGPSTWSTVRSPPFAEFDPTAFKAQSPGHTGLTNTLVINDPDKLYGQSFNINLNCVIHQGFLLAPETGNYTFIFGQADDIVLVWLGKNAYDGWTRPNADIERTYIPPPGDETETTRHLEQGTYYPVRVAWGDKGGNVAMSVRITAPNGTELTGRDGGYFRTEACDGSYGKFPAYGSS